jgi:hypothetical protein
MTRSTNRRLRPCGLSGLLASFGLGHQLRLVRLQAIPAAGPDVPELRRPVGQRQGGMTEEQLVPSLGPRRAARLRSCHSIVVAVPWDEREVLH